MRIREGFITAAGALFCSVLIHGQTLSGAALNAYTNYTAAKSNYVALEGNVTAAWKFARACADWADYAADSDQRATVAEEGINAAQFAVEMAPTNAAGFYYLGLNYGELARTKSFGALSLVKKMEHALLRARQIDPQFEHAGPDRSLGMLYRDAPGWPISIGNKAKSREHLEQAVKTAPDYPDNYLSLLEAYDKWNERQKSQDLAARYQKILPAAKQKYSGPEWAQAWRDWTARWEAIQRR